MCLALALAACGKPTDPPPVATSPTPTVAARATPREMLVDLARWDAATTADRRAAAEDVARRTPDFALLRLETFSCGGQTHEVAIYKHAKTEMEFVLVPGGTFVMGSDESSFDQKPRAVTLTRPFLIARTETTQAAWKKIAGDDPSAMKGADRPVESVSWDDSVYFCKKARVELPTAAQWERACRAGTTTRFCFGDDGKQLADYAWYESDPRSMADFRDFVPDERHCSHPVGRKKPNALGLYDMHGNVQEWCADIVNPDATPSSTDPFSATDAWGGHHFPVFRGGCWSQREENCRSAFRVCGYPNDRSRTIGFRPAKTVATD
jgi:formylglycine-generating enzyme required for sulfatase activity